MLNKKVVVLGAGGFIGGHLVTKLKEEGYETFSLGDGVRTEAKRQNLEPTGENLGKLMTHTLVQKPQILLAMDL